MHPIEHFFCPNPDCPDHGQRAHGNLYFRGYSGHSQRIRMIFCRTCKTHFSERKGTALEGARLAQDKVVAVLQHLQEGCGTRATSRLVGVNKNTVTRYALLAGTHARQLHEELVAFSPPHARSPGR
jgi:LacI family transcriptional regulator